MEVVWEWESHYCSKKQNLIAPHCIAGLLALGCCGIVEGRSEAKAAGGTGQARDHGGVLSTTLLQHQHPGHVQLRWKALEMVI